LQLSQYFQRSKFKASYRRKKTVAALIAPPPVVIGHENQATSLLSMVY
jgi:hypothetical protein